MARSEGNSISGKITYPDLNMTQYPDQIDSRKSTEAGYNENLKGFENLRDYNMAEHVNALSDAIMAIQRTLGIKPFVDKDGVNRTTVGNRIKLLESKDFDSRYGGVGWNPAETIMSHTHDGSVGGPPKINLKTETTGILNKSQLDLNYLNPNGLTGKDIAISDNSSTPINKAIEDKLSITEGGIIQKDLEVKGKLSASFYSEIAQADRIDGTVVADTFTKSRTAVKLPVKAGGGYNFVSYSDGQLEFGRYVAIIRAKVNNNKINETILSIRPQTFSSGWKALATKEIKATDFAAANKWQTFYCVFDYEANAVLPSLTLNLSREGSNAGIDLYFDYAHITSIHPAIYDK